jgi:hypothetical protein
MMDMEGFIETDEGALVMIDYKGYGRAYPIGRRQVVGAAWRVSSDEKYRFLNDAVSSYSRCPSSFGRRPRPKSGGMTHTSFARSAGPTTEGKPWYAFDA